MTGEKNFIDRLTKLSPFLASVLIPLTIALIGNWISISIKERENNIKMIEIAADILKTKPRNEEEKIRQWAISILKKHSSVPFPDDLSKGLLTAQLPATDSNERSSVNDKQSPISVDASKVATVFSSNLLLSGDQNDAIKKMKNGFRNIIENNTDIIDSELTDDDVFKLIPPNIEVLIKIGILDAYQDELQQLSSVYMDSMITLSDSDSADKILDRLLRGLDHATNSYSILMDEIGSKN